jgi:hypothetical protein
VVSVVDPLRSYSRLSRPEPLLLLPSSSSIVITRLSRPRSRPNTFVKDYNEYFLFKNVFVL